MNTIFRKIAGFLGLKLPDQFGMEGMRKIEQQGDQSNHMATIPGTTAMVRVRLDSDRSEEEVNKRSYF